MKHLTGVAFAAALVDLTRHAGFAEIFLGQDVGSDLGPERGNLDVFLPEDHLSIGIADLGNTFFEADALVWTLARPGKTSLYFHFSPPNDLTGEPVQSSYMGK